MPCKTLFTKQKLKALTVTNINSKLQKSNSKVLEKAKCLPTDIEKHSYAVEVGAIPRHRRHNNKKVRNCNLSPTVCLTSFPDSPQ